MVLSTFRPNLRMKAQARHNVVPENCGEYERMWEIWCIIVTKVTKIDGDSESNTSYRAVCATAGCRIPSLSSQLVSHLPVVCLSPLHWC